MAKPKQRVIVLDDDYALKLEDAQYIIAYKYRNGSDGSESWISDRYFKTLPSAIKALPDYIIRRSDCTTLLEMFEESQRIATMLGNLYNTVKEVHKTKCIVEIKTESLE